LEREQLSVNGTHSDVRQQKNQVTCRPVKLSVGQRGR